MKKNFNVNKEKNLTARNNGHNINNTYLFPSKKALRRISGFTLAEVLITLGIIGVVAAMTMPVLIQNHKSKVLETGLRKGYSTISQALDMYYAENGVRYTSERDNGNSDENDWLGLKNVLMKYIKNVKDCGAGSGSTAASACIPNNSYVDKDLQKDAVYKNFNGKTDISMSYFDDGQFVVNDGMLILLERPYNTAERVFISIDVNGYNKRPNRLGQDLFIFQIDSNGKLLPMGVEGTTFYDSNDSYCSSSSTDSMNGAGCTYRALSDPSFWKNLP